MANVIDSRGLGWLKDLPDLRDFSPETTDIPEALGQAGQTRSVNAMLQDVGVADASGQAPSEAVDLRQWCSPIENQGRIGACTAHAGAGLLEYFERRAHDRYRDHSRLFLYKVTRRLAGLEGDSGAFLRSTMGAMALFGVPPEQYWPYVEEDVDVEPPPFCFAFAQSYQALAYYRLDPDGVTGQDLLGRIKRHLNAGLPSMFGFPVFQSMRQAARYGHIPFPSRQDRLRGGHAVVAVGFSDDMTITNADGYDSRGALLIRNSWGTGWGDEGYGWLPYDYVLRGLARDWWSLLKNEWIATRRFGP